MLLCTKNTINHMLDTFVLCIQNLRQVANTQHSMLYSYKIHATLPEYYTTHCTPTRSKSGRHSTTQHTLPLQDLGQVAGDYTTSCSPKKKQPKTQVKQHNVND